MNRWIVPIISAAILVSAAGVAKMYAAVQGQPAAVFIAGDQPVSEQQVQTKLQSDGWVDVRTTQEGNYIRATGSVNGEPRTIIVDARTGRLRDDADDDDDD